MMQQMEARNAASGQSRHFALQKNREPFRGRTTVKSVTELGIEA
jgi:hypothetical protein